MKEKTFEELIDGKTFIENKIFEDDEDVKVVEFTDVIKLLQQVREATIAECEQYIRDNPEIALDFTRGREIKIDIPTDRILTEK